MPKNKKIYIVFYSYYDPVTKRTGNGWLDTIEITKTPNEKLDMESLNNLIEKEAIKKHSSFSKGTKIVITNIINQKTL